MIPGSKAGPFKFSRLERPVTSSRPEHTNKPPLPIAHVYFPTTSLLTYRLSVPLASVAASMHILTVLFLGSWLAGFPGRCIAGIVSSKDLNPGFFWGFNGNVCFTLRKRSRTHSQLFLVFTNFVSFMFKCIHLYIVTTK